MLGAIAMATSRIAIGTAATVLTLLQPLHIAKAAITLDRLAPGRFILGLGSGDRREEFAAFGVDTKDHKELYRAHWIELAAALERPSRIPQQTSDPDVSFELRPPALGDIPMLAVGSGGQTLDWIACHASGWATYHRPLDVQRDRHALWRQAIDRSAEGQFRSFSVALRIELQDDPAEAPEPIALGYRIGTRDLFHLLERMRENGVHHALLNILPNGVSPRQNLEIISRDILPAFR